MIIVEVTAQYVCAAFIIGVGSFTYCCKGRYDKL